MIDIKQCSSCKKDLSKKEFPKDNSRKDGLQYNCKVCVRKYRYQWRKLNKENIRKWRRTYLEKGIKEGTLIQGWVKQRYENIPCLDCDQTFPFCVMDFDHRPEETKSFGIADMGKLSVTPDRINTIMKEIDLCDIVCSNCHRIRTHIKRKI